MSKREEAYIDNLYKKFSALLNKFMESDVIDRTKKESVLDDLKFNIDNKIRELHNEDLLE